MPEPYKPLTVSLTDAELNLLQGLLNFALLYIPWPEFDELRNNEPTNVLNKLQSAIRRARGN